MSNIPDSTPVSSSAALSPKSLLATVGSTLKSTWQPVTLEAPQIDPDFLKLSGHERLAEVLRYKLLQLEYSLASGGGLRAWLRVNLLFSLLLAIPALIIVPVVTSLLGSFATWSTYLFETAYNILLTVLTIIATVFAVTIALHLLKMYIQRNRGK